MKGDFIMSTIPDLFESLGEYFSTMDWDTLLADFLAIFEGINFDLVIETFQSLFDTIGSLFA